MKNKKDKIFQLKEEWCDLFTEMSKQNNKALTLEQINKIIDIEKAIEEIE